jgi:hypothetical protein
MANCLQAPTGLPPINVTQPTDSRFYENNLVWRFDLDEPCNPVGVSPSMQNDLNRFTGSLLTVWAIRHLVRFRCEFREFKQH